jgi:hypothetical protein
MFELIKDIGVENMVAAIVLILIITCYKI